MRDEGAANDRRSLVLQALPGLAMPRLDAPCLGSPCRAVNAEGVLMMIADTLPDGETMQAAERPVNRRMLAVTPPEHAFVWWTLVVDVLAAARLTRLATKDSLPPLKDAREAALRRWRGSPWAVLVVCPWCFGFWFALLVFGVHVLLAFTAGPTGVAVYAMLLAPFAISHLIGLMSELESA